MPQGAEELGEPGCHVESSFLRVLEDFVVVPSFPLNLCRKTVGSLRPAICTGQKKVAERTSDAAVAVFEGVQRDEPQLREASLQDGMICRVGVHSVDHACQLSLNPSRGWSFEVNRRRPSGPETTCIGLLASSRSIPTRMGASLL